MKSQQEIDTSVKSYASRLDIIVWKAINEMMLDIDGYESQLSNAEMKSVRENLKKARTRISIAESRIRSQNRQPQHLETDII